MGDFEDRLGRALGEGAEDAPGAAGLADGARTRARRRRTWRVTGVGAAVALAVALPLTLTLVRDGADVTTVADAGEGWRTVSLERESFAPGPDTLTVLVDVPVGWVDLPDADDCGSPDLGVAVDGCESETLTVLADSGNLDFSFGPGLRAREDYGYPVDSDWGGYVDLGGAYAIVSSDDQQVALRVLASARYEGQDVPDLSGEWPATVRDGVGYRDPGLAALAGDYGVEVSDRLRREEYPYAEQLARDRWRASATVGEKRIEVVAPTSAIAQVVAGSARENATPEDGEGWQTVTYEGDPVAESGDGTIVLDLPRGWERLDGQGCGVAGVRYGDPALGCDQAPAVQVYLEAQLDYAGPGLSDDGGSSTGLVVVGRYVVSADGADYETVRRILASVRLPGEEAPSTTWRTETGAGYEVEVPDDDSVSVNRVSPSGVPAPAARAARRDLSGTWTAVVALDSDAVLVTAPTQALADVVASTVRPAS
jgi:hypothetical protein